jgi:hypothetical protein
LSGQVCLPPLRAMLRMFIENAFYPFTSSH